ncbi:hypothetical protein LV779_11930 [Streptomyces thinghirensis]|nr:hypothetical protein [Streptomyces thinghirensis]
MLALTSGPEGAEVQHAVRDDGRGVGAAGPWRTWPPRTPGGAPRVLRRGGRRTLGDLSSYDLGINGPLLPRRHRRPGRHPRICRGSSAAAVRNVVPNVSRGVLRHSPDVAALRKAADRFAEEIRTRSRRPDSGYILQIRGNMS